MSGYNDNSGFYPSNYGWPDSSTTGNGPAGPGASSVPNPAGYNAAPMYNPTSFGTPADNSYMYMQQNNVASQQFGQTGAVVEDVENEPPLLEELGINFDHIVQKTLAVLNPFRKPDASIMTDSDLAGPFVFCLLFGGLFIAGQYLKMMRLLSRLLTDNSSLMSPPAEKFVHGKIHFGYIYGIGVLGCLGMYSLLSLMSAQGVSMGCVVSVLGYCLLPMVLLSGVSIISTLQGIVGTVAVVLTIVWCSWSASKLFVTALSMDHQQPLVAYPCALLYGVFSLLTVF